MTEPTRPERRLWPSDVGKDVDDELAFHLEMRARDYARSGVPDHAARAAAERRFGDIEAVAQSCREIDNRYHQQRRRANMIADARQDAAYAVRALAKNRGFTAVAVLTLALGIGATTAIFSVIHAVLLRPLPYADSDRVVFLWTAKGETREPLTPGRLVDFRTRMTTVTGMAGISHIPLNLTGEGEPERLAGSSVSSSFFDVLGVRPMLGEPFHAGAADSRDVVLSHRLWIRRFGGDTGIVGRTIALNGTARRVAAVMPASFDWPAITASPTNQPGPEVWIPGNSRDIPRTPSDRDDEDLAANRGAGYLRAVARLKPGVTLAQARREAEAVAARLASEYPETDGARSAMLQPLPTQFFGAVRTPLLILFGAVAFVLAIVCANVAALLLGRATSRRREIALRLALGAGRGRIMRQLLTESLVLAMAGGASGLLLAWWGSGWLAAAVPQDILRVGASRLDTTAMAFAGSLALVTGLIFGIVPAWQSSRAPFDSLGDGGPRTSSGPRSGRARDILVAVQIGVALVLLVGAALLLRSFVSLTRVDTGIDTRNLLTFDLFLSGERAEYQSRQVAFYDQALARIRALPGVAAAAAAVTLPIGGDDFAAPVTIDGAPPRAAGEEARAGFQIVTPGYFHAMGIPVLAGRDFRDSDVRSAQPVVMVNREFVRQHWPGGDPLGRRLRIGARGDRWMTVVGVVGDIRHMGPATAPRPEFYQPHSQESFAFMAFVVRTSGDPAGVVPLIRAAVTSLDPAQPLSGVSTMEDHIARALARPKFMSTLIAAFGAVAVTLAIVGVYGVMAYAVTQRAREIAIRVALGARGADIMGGILGKALVLAIAGSAGGLIGAAAMSRVLEGLLFGVSASDPATFVSAALVLVIVAVLAAAVPAVRAGRIDGAAALKS